MFDEFSVEVFIIKIKINGYLENKQTKEKEIISTNGIQNKNIIKYNQNNTNYTIKIFEEKIILIRENEQMINTFIFELQKSNKSEYFIKEYSTNIDIQIKTTKLLIDRDIINVEYIIEETFDKYEYLIEMSEKL